MTKLLRFNKPDTTFGRRCEKCNGAMKGHRWIDLDPGGRVIRCSNSVGKKAER